MATASCLTNSPPFLNRDSALALTDGMSEDDIAVIAEV